MARTRPPLLAFNNGEISELAQARVDLDSYQRSLSRCLNFLPLRQGGITRRPGSRYVATVRNSARPSFCMPFIFSDDDAVLLVLNDGYIRFFKDHAPIESSPGVPYEIAHPWDDSVLFKLSFVQSADVLYVTTESYSIYLISRLADTNWTITFPSITQGPFLDDNTDLTITVTPSVLTGAGTLTASSAIFSPDHVGALFLIWATDLTTPSLSPWEPSKAVVINTRTYYNGRIYLALNSATTGTVPPTQDEGNRWDGQAAASVEWAFESSLYGIVSIQSYTSSTQVGITVLKTLPSPVAFTPSNRWAFGAWSVYEGLPRTVTFYQDRLTFGGTTNSPDTIWMSASGDYLNFAPRDSGGLVVADLGITVTTSSQSVNVIRQMVPDGAGLYCLTTGGAFLIAPSTTNSPLGPDNIRAIPQTTLGAALVRPARSGPVTLSVQKGGRVLLANVYTYDNDRYVATNTTLLNPGVLKTGAIQIDYAQEPHSILWCVLEDGTLAALTYDQQQELNAWSRHEMGGTDAAAKSLAVIPAPDGVVDDPWLVVSRTVGGSTVQFVEYIDGSWALDGDAAEAYYVDAGLTQTGAASTITGLSHLEGQTVDVWVNGASHPQCEVSGGSITLNASYSTRTAGLPCWPNARTVRIEAGAQDGTAQGSIKRWVKPAFRIFNSLAFLFGTDTQQYRTQLRRPDMNMSGPVTPFTGNTDRASSPSGYDTDGWITMTQDQAGPLTILAVYLIEETAGT